MALIYGVTSILSQKFGVIPPGNATAIFAPSGIALAAVYFFGYKITPGILLGSFLGNNNLYVPDFGTIGFEKFEFIGLVAGLAIGLGAAIEASLGYYLLKRFGDIKNPFGHVRSVWVFVLLSALASCLVNATIGSSSLVFSESAPSAAHGSIWLTWWLGDAAGIIILAPLLMTWRKLPKPSNEGNLVFESAMAFISLMGIGTIAFVGGFPIEYLLIPIVVYIVLRFGLHGATLATFLVSGFAIWGTVQGNSSFVQDNVNDSFLFLQAFISTVIFTALTLAAEDKERRVAQGELEETNRNLEKRVVERTEQLAIAKEEAESASRAKTLFIAQMSHEFRTPLNAVIGYSDILQMGMLGDMNTDQTERIGFIKQNANRLLGLINDTLDISQIEAGKMTLNESRVDVHHFFEEILKGVKSLTAKKQISINTQYHPNTPERIIIDAPKVQQIVVNLVGNAIKFTPQGEITIEVGVHNAKEWFLCVRDTGIGMSPESLQKIFNQYHRIEKDTKNIEGSGLGLSITKRLVEFLQGRVDVQSELGKGSAFTVTLPLSVIELGA